MPTRILFVALCCTAFALAGENVEKVFVAKSGTIRESLHREGRLVPADATPISLELEAYTGTLRVLEVKGHGARVQEGDALIEFDLRAIDRQIRRAELELETAELAYQNQQKEGALAHEKEAQTLETHERSLARARRALDGFLKHEVKHREEQKRLDRLWRTHRQDDQQDELVQLEKMYTDDELVDATEEIVLKRSRRNLKRTVEQNQLYDSRRAYDEEYKEPLREEDLRIDVEYKTAALNRLDRSQTIARSNRDSALKESAFGLTQKKRQLEELRRDRRKLVVRAPRAGILLHGDPEAVPAAERLKRGSRVKTWDVFLSVADGEKLKALTDVPEAQVLEVSSGMDAVCVPKARKTDLLPGKIDVAFLPNANHLHRVDVSLKRADSDLRPGMRCDVWIRLPEEKAGVLLPLTCFDSPKEGEVEVQVRRAGAAETETAKIKLGPSDGVHVLVEEGLQEGDRVVVTDE